MMIGLFRIDTMTSVVYLVTLLSLFAEFQFTGVCFYCDFFKLVEAAYRVK